MRFFSSTELFKNWICSPQIIWLSKKPIVLSCWISMQYIGWKVERSQFRCSVLENSLKKLFQYETQAKKDFYFFAALVALCVHTQTDSKLWRAAFAIPAMFFFRLDLSRNTLKAFEKTPPLSPTHFMILSFSFWVFVWNWTRRNWIVVSILENTSGNVLVPWVKVKYWQLSLYCQSHKFSTADFVGNPSEIRTDDD